MVSDKVARTFPKIIQTVKKNIFSSPILQTLLFFVSQNKTSVPDVRVLWMIGYVSSRRCEGAGAATAALSVLVVKG